MKYILPSIGAIAGLFVFSQVGGGLWPYMGAFLGALAGAGLVVVLSSPSRDILSGKKKPDPSEVSATRAVNQVSDSPSTKKRESTSQELSVLWRDYRKTNSKELRDILATHFLHLVEFNAERLAAKLPGEVELEGLIKAGTFGLLDAIEAFDPDRGIKFETYCAPRIRGAILDEIRSMNWVPRLLRARGKKPETPSQEAHRRDLNSLITKSFSRTESIIMSLYYYEDCTMKEIANILNLSVARVSEIHESILKRLKKILDDRRKDWDEESSD